MKSALSKKVVLRKSHLITKSIDEFDCIRFQQRHWLAAVRLQVDQQKIVKEVHDVHQLVRGGGSHRRGGPFYGQRGDEVDGRIFSAPV